MSVHLVGGGLSETPNGAAYAAFLAEAGSRAASAGRVDAAGRPFPRIAVIAVRADGAEHAARLVAETAAAFDPVVTVVAEGAEVPAAAIADVDGILVGGGLTPAYRLALEPRFGEIRRQVAAGIPYLGFSAGAAIAAERALVGGWRVGGVAVAPEEAAEDLDELTVEGGIGLVDVAIDVHAAQWGTLSRLIAAVEAGIVDGGLAIDEHTALIVGEGGLGVAGAGSVWRVLPDEHGVLVSTIGA
ncbi:Type 1 glutamine amidotransferase-like domain-containing protein [Agromyces archimandritae]|uniref:Type 1 glutamine amidotransferase-like domain-containing protein n=1 Tax=Agromyces archimandritae TaxID=2781962 RepID=A0A975FP08_9MICO|nr:Type 1 glutamine amidotransferase-like domain-containing protein [Agromyces archimandritae]QTX05192.1 Type 1 glutamine amidotransferase-like domain-containing protein [Agromyces archimandritae]